MVPSATLPSTSWPSSRKERSDSAAPGSTSGRAMVRTTARKMTTTTSEVITKPRVKSDRGPLARVWERTPSVAEGLRVMASIPQRSETPTIAVTGSESPKGRKGRSAKNVPAMRTSTSTFWSKVDQSSDRAAETSIETRRCAPPASEMSESARALIGERSSTVWRSTRFPA